MKVLPFVSSGEPFLNNDGTLQIVPMQLFLGPGGRTILRMGHNVFLFDASGKYTGCEMSGDRSNDGVEVLTRVLKETAHNQGHAPDEAYFHEGSDGWKREIAGWPKEAPAAAPEPITIYVVPGPHKKTTH
jgi:hypothetical protein